MSEKKREYILKEKYERVYKNTKVLNDFDVEPTMLGNSYHLSEGKNRFVAQQLYYKRDAEIETGIYAVKKNDNYILNYCYALEKLGTVDSSTISRLLNSGGKQLNISKFLPKLNDWYKSKGSGIEHPVQYGEYLDKEINEGLDEYDYLTGDE